MPNMKVCQADRASKIVKELEKDKGIYDFGQGKERKVGESLYTPDTEVEDAPGHKEPH